MKKIVSFFTLLLSVAAFAQNNDKPFASIGKEGELLSLSNGRYEEVFKNEKLRRVGSVMMNTETMKIDHFLTEEELKECQDLETEKQASRFLSIDPLARQFPYYSPFQYAGNQPIACIDLDGLERVLAITFNGDVNYRADRLELMNGEEISKKILTSNPAQQMVEGLKEATAADENGIGFVAIWGHGTPNSQWGTDGTGVLQKDDLDQLQTAINNGEIRFTENAIVYIGNCNAGTLDEDGVSFAQKMADITGAKVVAGSTGDYNDPERSHRGSVGVKNESNGQMEYSLWYPALDKFTLFKRDVAPEELSGSINIKPLLERGKLMPLPQMPVIEAKEISGQTN